MTGAQYIEHFKVLGKLCRLWDDASADSSATKELISRAFDQIATGELDSYETILLLNPYTPQLNNGVAQGADAIQTVAKNMAAAYLISSIFRGDLTTTPTQANSAQSVLEALQTEMGAGVDNVTLTDTAATGFVNFFDTVWAPSGAWNTLADASATYKDSVYVVTTIV